MFLPALKVTLSPGLTFSMDVPFVVPPLLEDVTFQPELLIASVTLVVVAIPSVVGALALPSLLGSLVIVPPTLAFTLIPVAVASVEIRAPSPLTLKVPSLRRTSVLPVTCVESPAYFKLTAFN